MHPSGVTQVSQKVVQVTPTGSQRTRRGAPREPEKVPNGTYFCGFLDFFTGYVWGVFFFWFSDGGQCFSHVWGEKWNIAEDGAKIDRPCENAANTNENEGLTAREK